MIDVETRGAVRLLQHPGIVEPLDAAAVAEFQRRHGLPDRGEVDEATRVAMAAVLAGSLPGARTPREGERRQVLDPVACFRELDPAEVRSVCRFQKSLGIPASGDVDGETRGAMRAMRAWLTVDPLDAEAVREYQRNHGIAADGVIGERTRAAIERERRATSQSPSPAASEPDVFQEASVREFQRRHGLQPSGTIDTETRQAILWERDHYLSVDAAEVETIRAFQRRHRLRDDGVLGPQTQAAMTAARREREPDDDGRRRDRYGAAATGQDERLFDPADTGAVRRFQRAHRLAPDGVIGSATRTAMRSVRRGRAVRGEQDADGDGGNDHRNGGSE